MFKTIGKLFICCASIALIIIAICQIVLYGAYYVKESTFLDNLIAFFDITAKLVISIYSLYLFKKNRFLEADLGLGLLIIGFGIFYSLTFLNVESNLTYNYRLIDTIVNIVLGFMIFIGGFWNRRGAK